MSHSFKVGDEVVLLDNGDYSLMFPEYVGETFVVHCITAFTFNKKDTFRIELNESGLWAEPHEIRHLTPLEKVMK